MATGQLSEVIQHLRRAMLLRDGAGLTDGQLLEDYISRGNATALAALVQRHGPMVWIAEYFVFDPEGLYLDPRLQGFRLVKHHQKTTRSDSF